MERPPARSAKPSDRSVPDHEEAVPMRILRFFDALSTQHATLEHIVVATSAWLDRPVGVRRDDLMVVAAGGGLVEVWPENAASMYSAPDGVVLALCGDSGPDDAAILHRLAVCVSTAMSGHRAQGSRWETSRAVGVLISETASHVARRAALEQVGLRPHSPLRVVVAHGAETAIEAWVKGLESQGVSILTTTRGKLTVLLAMGGRLSGLLQQGVPRGLQVGLSREIPAAEAAAGLAEALAAFRFSQPSPRDQGPYLVEEGVAFEYWRLRGYEALAEALTPAAINRVQDVTALDRALASGGPELLRTLDVVVAATSIRQAARSLDTHHNTVAHRVAAAEEDLGFSLADSYGRCRLYVAIVLRRLRESAALAD